MRAGRVQGLAGEVMVWHTVLLWVLIPAMNKFKSSTVNLKNGNHFVQNMIRENYKPVQVNEGFTDHIVFTDTLYWFEVLSS